LFRKTVFLLTFIIPGILLVLSGPFRKKGLAEFLVYAVGLSLAYSIVFAWYAKFFHTHLALSFYLTTAACLIVLAVKYKTIVERFRSIDRSEIFTLAAFAGVMLLRLMPMFLQLAPAGADMSMHAYITRLIIGHNGIPNSYEPLLPIAHFGSYPAGFPTLCALITLLGGLSVQTSCMLMTCVTHALITFGLYVLLLRYFNGKTSALTAIAATFLTRDPQWMIRWGGNPTVLALFFFVLAFALIIEQKEGYSTAKAAFAALALSATLLTHSIIFYIGTIVLLTYFVATFMTYKDAFKTAGAILIAGAALILPYAINVKFNITGSALDYVRTWQAVDAKSVMYDLIGGIPFILTSLYGFYLLFKKDRPTSRSFLMIYFVVLLLIANYKFWLLPMSYLLYPGRGALFLIIPMSIFAAPAIIGLYKRSGTITALAILIGLSFFSAYYIYNSVSQCSVTDADIAAFKWIDENAPENAVFMNNYGDAGLWIPAIAGRTIKDPQTEPVNMEELRAGTAKLKAGYVYIGSKKVYGCAFNSKDLAASPGRFKLLYDKGAQVWKVI
jgi:hypothetical protein